MLRLIALFFISLTALGSTTPGGAPFGACEIQLAKYINGYQFAQADGAHRFNFWNDDFNAKWMLSTFKEKKELVDAVGMLKNMLDRDQVFASNVKKFVDQAVFENRLSFTEVKAIFREKKVNATLVSFSQKGQPVKGLVRQKTKFIHLKVSEDAAALKTWLVLNQKKKLSKFYQKEYQRILFSLNFTTEEFELLAKHFTPTDNLGEFKIFEEYMDFIRFKRKDLRITAIKNIKEIYTPISTIKGTPSASAVAFKKYRKTVNRYLDKRTRYYQEHFKKQNKGTLTDKLRLRAKQTAGREGGIFKKLLAGCKSSYKSKSLRTATRKFKRFKIASTIGFGTWGYYDTNKDKLDPNHSWQEILKYEFGMSDKIEAVGDEYDPYWFRRFGYEMGVGLAFTWVNNMIVTNTGTSTFHKAWSGYLKFSTMDVANAWGYDQLFGNDPKRVQKEFEELRKDPNFQKKLASILDEVINKTDGATLKKFLDQHFNFSASTSAEDLQKITLEDLESDEAREMILELLTERMYLNNMGDIPVFQSGNTGVDRWAFYRAFNIPNTFKSLAVDLLIFRIMCMASGPNSTQFATAKAFMIALGIQIADKMVFTPIQYQIRRKATNQ